MKKKVKVVGLLMALMCMVIFTACGGGKKQTAKTDLFEVEMPDDFEGLYDTVIENNTVSFYEVEARAGDFGGFAFAVSAYENPDDYANANAVTKIGELKTKDGKLYDVVMSEPSDVQYDMTSDEQSVNYMKLYNYRQDVGWHIVGEDGATYNNGQGIHGEDLYGDVIKRHITAIQEGWDPNKLEAEGMSSMYSVISDGKGADVLDNIGFFYKDINYDGIDELMIGEIAEGEWKGIIYDLYTMKDRSPIHVISGYDRDRYYISDPATVVEEYSAGAGESGWVMNSLYCNSADLVSNVAFKYDSYTDPDNPYFVSYNLEGDEWENVTEADFEQLKGNYGDYLRIDYTPLSEFDENARSIQTSPILKNDVAREMVGDTDITEEEAVGILSLFALFGMGTMLLICLILYLVEVVGLWKVYKKMGEPGWKSLIPVYNTYILYKRTWTTGAFWVMLILSILGGVMTNGMTSDNVTVVGIIGCVALVLAGIIDMIQNWKFIRAFGKGIIFFILFLFFEPIMVIILGFGKSKYYDDEV